jgi:hypothetical protein
MLAARVEPKNGPDVQKDGVIAGELLNPGAPIRAYTEVGDTFFEMKKGPIGTLLLFQMLPVPDLRHMPPPSFGQFEERNASKCGAPPPIGCLRAAFFFGYRDRAPSAPAFAIRDAGEIITQGRA